MITPADLARMLGQTANSADNHTQVQLLYTSETPRKSADLASDDTAEGAQRTSAEHDAQSTSASVPATHTHTENEHCNDIQHSATRPAHPTPATVFGMRATVTIATASGTIEGQSDDIAAEADADTVAVTVSATVSATTMEATASQPLEQPAPAHPTPATVFGGRTPHAFARRAPRGPSPAMMPQRRKSDNPTTFASLDAQELPVVREYSAGGLIFDDQNRVAIIARHSRSGHLEWCLPKGHIERGETPQQTAVREVHEETGILGEVIDSIATIDYWFTGSTQRVHKLVHHYALRQIGGSLSVEGDPDHEAEDAIWVRFDDLDDVLSYPNERKIAWLYAKKKKNRQANE